MKSILRVVVALLAFLIGVSTSQLRSLCHRKVVQSTPIPSVKIVDQPAISPSSETWRRIVITDRFSLSIPSYLNDDGHSLSRSIAVGAFRANYDRSGLFYLYYCSRREAEEDSKDRIHDKYRNTTRSEVMIGGRHASMVTEIPAQDEILCIHDVPEVSVFFPDIGGGRKLYMRLASSDNQGIEVAKRVIYSIEFPGAIASNTRLERTRRQ